MTVSRLVDSLLLYHGVLGDEIGTAWLTLLDAVVAAQDAHDSGFAARDRAVRLAHGKLFSLLARQATSVEDEPIGDPWQIHLLNRILDDENAFSLKSRLFRDQPASPELTSAARHDLNALQAAYRVSSAAFATAMGAGDSLPRWDRLRSSSQRSGAASPRNAVKAALANAADWTTCLGELERYYRNVGPGALGRYRAFRWIKRDGVGEIKPIDSPDPIRLKDLVGYDDERQLLVQNTEQLLAGYRANNVLIYGDRGTGKSSTVKALLNAGAGRGLRLIEVAKNDLADYPDILAVIRGRPEKFILFVDDLSFDEHETQYKELKAVLEGGLEARPDNVVLYATSNRRHLIQERFSDRRDPGDEVRGQDTLQEKLSLGDRFGITITFAAPDQERYLTIVEALAQERGIELDRRILRQRAIQWALWHNGRSGRCARQFVDHLAGELRVDG